MKELRAKTAINLKYAYRAKPTILNGARTSKLGDGEIFAQNLEQCIRKTIG